MMLYLIMIWFTRLYVRRYQCQQSLSRFSTGNIFSLLVARSGFRLSKHEVLGCFPCCIFVCGQTCSHRSPRLRWTLSVCQPIFFFVTQPCIISHYFPYNFLIAIEDTLTWTHMYNYGLFEYIRYPVTIWLNVSDLSVLPCGPSPFIVLLQLETLNHQQQEGSATFSIRMEVW